MGLATVKLLAEEGANVVMGDIQWELAQKNAKSIGSSVLPFQLNQGSAQSVEEAIKFTEEKFGGLDFAVNAAAIQGPLGPIEDLEPKDMANVLTVNLAGIAYCLKYEVLAMKRRGGGAIVNIASISGMRPTPYLGIYSASKTGVITLTNIAAVENGPDGIRVNCISPGYVDTPLLDARIDRGWAASMTPNRRCGVPRDIADVTAFLLSDDAKQVNGITMPVDGGLIAGHAIKPPGF
jgi:NAD(P)-dependent dehydrogenase (short-subunit alcohol dehydrogenase family)